MSPVDARPPAGASLFLWGVVVFPGTNCDGETLHVLTNVLGCRARAVWHEERSLAGIDGLVLPGGFAHGDYLRAGAVARFSPVMDAVAEFAARGGPVIGICNGFQVLLEAGLLPGAMLRNRSQQFSCRWVNLLVEPSPCRFTRGLAPGRILRIPIAHGEGCYTCDEETLARLERERQVVLRYSEPDGRVTPDTNPNGSIAGIAGICSAAGNVFGLMPHPERAAEQILGSDDGRRLFTAILDAPVA